MRNAVGLMWKSSSVRARFETTGDADARGGGADLGVGRPAGARQRHRPRHAGATFRGRCIARHRPQIAIGETGDVFARAMQRWQRDREFAGRSSTRRSATRRRAGAPGTSGPGAERLVAVARRRLARRDRSPRQSPTRRGGSPAIKIVDPSFRNWFGAGDGDARPGDLRFPALQQELQPVLLRARSVGAGGRRCSKRCWRAPGKATAPGHTRRRSPGCRPCSAAARKFDQERVRRRLRRLRRGLPGRCAQPCRSGLRLDLGRCIFCGECAAACPRGAISFTQDWRLGASRRGDLVVSRRCSSAGRGARR